MAVDAVRVSVGIKRRKVSLDVQEEQARDSRDSKGKKDVPAMLAAAAAEAK